MNPYFIMAARKAQKIQEEKLRKAEREARLKKKDAADKEAGRKRRTTC